MSRWQIYEVTTDADGVDCYIKRGEIVRCRECKHENNCEHQVLLSTMWGEAEDTADIEYCSYGEREGE